MTFSAVALSHVYLQIWWSTVEPVLKDHPIRRKDMVSQRKWTLETGSIVLKCGTFCQEYVVLQDGWSFMAVVETVSLKIRFTVFQQWPLAREGNYCTSVTYMDWILYFISIRHSFPLALKHYKTVTCQLILYDKIITEYLKDKLIHTSNWQYMYM